MKKLLPVILALTVSVSTYSQHCPWDCTGLIMIQTPLSAENFYKLSAMLVDENRKPVVDTIYGTGKGTHDVCKFLLYEDFTQMRKAKISNSNWYAYDTVYLFAAGNYIVKFNYCKYNNKKLYLQFLDPYTRGLRYHYIQIPQDKRIHLHNYSEELFGKKVEQLKKAADAFVLKVNCGQWGLRKPDCK